MNCTECLHLMSTADLAELTTATAVIAHCQTCADCATLVDDVVAEARRMGDTLDGTPPGLHPHLLALQAVAASTRGRQRARRLRIAAVAALVVVPVALVGLARRTPPPAAQFVTRIVELKCLDPEQIAELVREEATPPVTVTARRGSRLPIITVRGPRADVEAMERTITKVDARWAAERSSYCAVAPGLGAPGADAQPTRAPGTKPPASTPARGGR